MLSQSLLDVIAIFNSSSDTIKTFSMEPICAEATPREILSISHTRLSLHIAYHNLTKNGNTNELFISVKNN